MNRQNMAFEKWYSNISKFLTRKEAMLMGRNLLDDVCEFLDKRSYEIAEVIRLRNRCWRLQFPQLHRLFSELIEIENEDGHLTPRMTIKQIEQHCEELVRDFNDAAA